MEFKQWFERLYKILRGGKLFTKILVLEFILLLFFGLSLWYTNRVDNTAFGPRMAFVARGVFPDGGGGANNQGYRVTLDFHGSPAVSHPGLLLPRNNSKLTVFESDSFGTLTQSKEFSIQEIAKLEFKKLSKDSSSVLWAIQRVNTTSLIPHTRLYVIKASEFELWWKPPSADEFEKLKMPNKIDVRMQDEINLNGIEITTVNDTRILWLLGYDGTLYKHALGREKGTETGSIFKRGPMTLAAAASEDLQYVSNLSSVLDSTYSTGWQSLDAIEGEIEGAPAASEVQYFLSTNAIKQEFIVFGIPRKNNTHPLILWKFPILNDPGQPRWDEGSIAFRSPSRDNSPPAHHLISTEAFAGKLSSGHFDANTRNFLPPDSSYSFVFQKSSRTDSIQLFGADGEPAYVEGAALGLDEHVDLYVSDREGNIHIVRCFHNRLNADASWNPFCTLRKLTPPNIVNLVVHGTLDQP